MKITYSLQEFRFINENQKSVIGWVTLDGLSDSKKDAHVMSYSELMDKFTPQEMEQLFSRTHDKYILIEKCKELNEIFSTISQLKNYDFYNEKVLHFDDFILRVWKNERFMAEVTFRDGKQLNSDWGLKSCQMTKNVIIDKLCRHYGFKDPYKHYVSETLVAENITS